MLYIYNSEGFFLKKVEKGEKSNYPNSTEKQPILEKLNSPTWQTKFNKDANEWEYTKLDNEGNIEPTDEELLAEQEMIKKAEAALQKVREEEIKKLANEVYGILITKILGDADFILKLGETLNANK